MLTRLATLLLFTCCSFAIGQSTTQENLGVLKASVVANGLGWQVNGSHEIEFAAAAAAGAKHVRLNSCVWSQVEMQSDPPENVSRGYTLPPGCVSALVLSKKYDLSPTIIAAFGAPFHQILTVSVSSGANAGSTTLDVEYSSGVGGDQLSSISYPNDYLIGADGSQLTPRYSYDGSLITGIQHKGSSAATITLSSALTHDLAPGTLLAVNEVLYPSAVTAKPTEPSNMAFARYARYLATQMQAYGLSGEVELWNEPPWNEDCWDNRADCYDKDPQFPDELKHNTGNFGFAAALQTTVPVPGVSYVWAGTNKSGSADLLGANMDKYAGVTFIEGQEAVTSESMHPYGSNPEDAMWNQPCLLASYAAGQKCNTVPAKGSNYVNAEANTLVAQEANPSYGVKHVITETGASSLYMPADHMARFATRQFLGWMADSMSFIDFYTLYDTSTPGQSGFGFIELNDNDTTYTPLANYTAMAGLMSDVATMELPPVASYSDDTLPAVTSYSGAYSLDHLAVVGARQGDNANSVLYFLFQRSVSPNACDITGTVPCWGTLAQPDDGQTTVSVPSGLKVAQVINLDTRKAVAYTLSGSSLTLGVSDDPIELMLVPSPDATSDLSKPRLVFDAIEQQLQGNTLTVGAFSTSSGAISYSVVSGPASISGNVVHIDGAGSIVLRASQAASGKYLAASTTIAFASTAKDPGLNFRFISPKRFGDVFAVRAGSASNGTIVYSVASGPAVIAGSTVTTTGSGSVTLKATQAANGEYASTTATSTFTVVAITPNLTFSTIRSHTYGDVFGLQASSPSTSPILFSVVSGPATVSGSTLTTTGTGEVWVMASQAANGGYSEASVTASFHVGAADPTLVITPIADKPLNTSFTVSATSQSPNKVVYSVLSGPAKYVGSTISTEDKEGTVVVQAVQYGGGNWNQVSATTSFKVKRNAKTGTTPNLGFTTLSAHVVGDVFPVSATSNSKGAITYSLASGPGTITGSRVTATGVGSIVLTASQAADGDYTAATATTTVTINSSVPTLAFAPITSHAFGDTFSVSAGSASKGAISYSVVSGPATLDGSTISTTGVGAVVLSASQAASGNYGAATATISFTIVQAVPTLTFGAVSAHTIGDVFAVNATSASSGTITYSVVSGPATLSGSTVTVNNVGTVMLSANQVGSANYTGATATTSFIVVSGLQFQAISTQTAGSVFQVVATSASTGPITYSVVSGPAIFLDGSSCEPTGPGTVVLKAYQAASGRYPGMNAQTSFTVTGSLPSNLTFVGIGQKVIGNVFTAHATSASNGAITYSVLSGGATIADAKVTITGTTGTVTLQASQVATGSYPAATTTITFPITVLAPTLTLIPVAAQRSGDVFQAAATSDSGGALTFSIVSGPAKVSGSTVTTTGPGTVILRVDLSAKGAYGPANESESIEVN